jgi:DMSO/TMAO reductase YedYZ molybdopterin-dependent catalytic subunit
MRKNFEMLDLSRRGFIRNSGLAALSTALGSLLPDALAGAQTLLQIPGKSGLVVLNDRPINAETPAYLLDDAVTPTDRLFVRNNGIPPAIEGIDADQWTLQIDGESCIEPKSFTLAELKSKFEHQTLQLQIECAGNGRSEYYPPATGNQWTTGAIGCPEWTGVRLSDVLADCGIADDAVYVAYEGADRHLSGDPGKLPISRGVPVAKALEKESLIAWAMNGESLPLLHGFPLRMVCAGWPASVSGKWIKKIMIRDRVHDGEKMTGSSYRVPCKPVAPGAAVANEDMCIIESLPVKSLITFPKSGVSHAFGQPMAMRGHAWAGDLRVRRMFVSTNFGATWQRASLDRPVNRLAWQRWSAVLDFPAPGYYEVWARAEDENQNSQPMVLPGWNPRGYLNNACHRIAVEVHA